MSVGEVLDQYRITGLISRGPTSSIFKALDPVRAAPVAIKVPHPAYEGDLVFAANLAREERITTRLNHPGVLKALTPVRRSRPYLVTEFAEGVTLRTRLIPHRWLDTDAALGIARQLAEILAYLHTQQVVHRDLKPENVQLLPGGGVKLLDFGLALDHAPRWLAWLGSTTVGTPDYMAPEQAKGLPGDERSDIYALGVTLYEMLTGALPFPADDPFLVMQIKLESDPIPPTRFRPELAPELEEIILHAIERGPARRYATAAALLTDLRDPARVPLTGRAARLRPRSVRDLWARRVARYTALGLGTVAGLVLLVWLANRYPAGPPITAPAPGEKPVHASYAR